jgi:excinuclease ABC subunit C
MLEYIIKKKFVKEMRWTPYNEEQIDLGGGVYRMFDKLGKIIYVGKSNDLHERIRNHLSGNTNTDYFISKVKAVEWFPVKSPVYRTLIEGVLIAYYRPRYNSEVKEARKHKPKR